MWHFTRFLKMTGLWNVSLWSVSLLVGAALGDDPKCLQVGDSIPEFQCLDDQGKMWDSREYAGKHMLVIYFYPSDFAFCCTSQAQRYRDCQRELADQGVKLIGISGDTVLAHGMFKTTCSLNFPLLADVDGSIARKFGVPLRSGGKAMLKRSTEQYTSCPWETSVFPPMCQKSLLKPTLILELDGPLGWSNL